MTISTIVLGIGAASTPAVADGVSAWDDLRAAVAAGGTVQLTGDVTNTPGQNLPLGTTPVILDLNGHNLNIDASGTRGAAGVEVGPSANLTIRDTAGGGQLTAYAGDGGAGIGGNGSPDNVAPPEAGAGSVTIDSGTIVATGGTSGAGIGGGAWGDANCGGFPKQDGGTTIASFTVNGGTVTATGGYYAAAIGSSDCSAPAHGLIKINAGMVTATGGFLGAGIGGGYRGDAGPVEIGAAAVTTSGGVDGPGIGGLLSGKPNVVKIGAGGVVKASGGYNAPGVGTVSYGPDGGELYVAAGGTLVPSTTGDYCISVIGSCFGTRLVRNDGRIELTDANLAVDSGDDFANSGTVTLLRSRIDGVDGAIKNTGAIIVGANSNVAPQNTSPNKYTLDFDAAGGPSPETLRVFAATVAASEQSLPAAPAGNGAFIGWFTKPSAAAGTVGDTKVTNTSDLATVLGGIGPKQATLYARFQTSKPTVDSITPASGKSSGGDSVTISGTGFADIKKVIFGQTPATSFTANSYSSITAVAPAHSRGAVDVRVITKLGTSPIVAGDRYTYRSIDISRVSPAAGPSTGGTAVTISGTDLVGATSMTFGDSVAAFKPSGSTLVATAPAGAVGDSVDVTVSGPYGTATVADAFRYVAVPVVTSLDQSQGKAAGGDTVVISGSGLGENPTVYFGSKTAKVVSKSDTALTVTSPAGYRGAVDVRVRTVGGTSAASAADKFTYRLTAISAVSPTAGPVAGGNKVTITGYDLTSATSVSFGGVDVPFEVKGSTLLVTAPAGSAGQTVYVSVTTPYNVSIKTDAYRYVAPPVVTSLDKSSGSVAGGETVVITGTGLGDTPTVLFGTRAGTVVSKSDTELTVRTPASARGVVDVRVRTPGGTSPIVDADQFSFVNRATVSPS